MRFTAPATVFQELFMVVSLRSGQRHMTIQEILNGFAGINEITVIGKDQALSASSSERGGGADWAVGTSSVFSSGEAGITSFRRLAAAFSAAAHHRWLSGSS
jgi:hypothetical protein